MSRQTDENKVWYLSYGSNLCLERFLCYIQGGTPEGGQREFEGCRDKSFPEATQTMQLNRNLYFALQSRTWQNGGVAFISTEEEDSSLVYAQMYLVKESQFNDIVKQENDLNSEISVNFTKLTKEGFIDFEELKFYNRILFLGKNNGFPIVTFTHKHNIQKLNSPSKNYLNIIAKGLKNAWSLSEEEIKGYFGRFL